MPRIERICIDALQVAPEFSGIGRRVAELGRDLRERPPGVPVHVRCARDIVELLRPEFPPDTTFSTPVRSSRPRGTRIAFQQLIGPLRDGPETLLVCPGDQAPLLSRAPYVFVLHDVRRVTMPRSTGSVLEALYYRLVIRFGLRRATAILTISEFSKSEIVRLYRPSAPIEIVTSRLDPDPATPHGVADPPRLLIVGAIRPYKGLETVIRALAYIRGAGEPVPRVTCVGSEEKAGHLTEELRELAAELHVADALELCGWLPDGELRRLYGECTASINPSEYEGYGLTVAESLANGLPTIASDIPSHREIAGDAALYFPPRDVRRLVDALRAMTADSALRERLREDGLRRAAAVGQDSVTWAEAIGAVATALSGRAALRDPAGG